MSVTDFYRLMVSYLRTFTDQESLQVPLSRVFVCFCRIETDTYHRGSKCYFPVFVKGANLSVGDLHFSQGDVRSFPLIGII
jgi:Acetamidase/Formamidase family